MIPLVDLPKQHARLARKLLHRATSVMKESMFIDGPQVEQFEQQFAKYIGVRYGIGVSNGTDALVIALRALSIGPGDEVIVPAFTFVSTVFAVIISGATPILVDVEPTYLSIDIEKVARAITSKTKAILPVHLYGTPADMDALMRIASKHHIHVIEDAAQAHGSLYKGKKCGSIGHIGCFSFYPSKNLGSLGDAGAVVTNNHRFTVSMKQLRNIGQSKKHLHTVVSGNTRLDTLQAAFLLEKLPHLEGWNTKRRHHAARLTSLLYGLPIQLPKDKPDCVSNYHLYVIRTKRRKALQKFLLQHGVETGIHYPQAVHQQPALKHLYPKMGQFPISERAAKEVVSLPMYPELTMNQIHTIAHAVRSFFRTK